MNRMFLLCGPAFSGKSTLATSLARKSAAVVVSLDDINAERGVGYGGNGLSVEIWSETLEIALLRLAEVMATGRDVIIDDTNCYRWLRDEYRNVARRNGYREILIFLDTPLEEIARRRRGNARNPKRRDLKDEVLRTHLESFEYPQADEPCARFEPDDSLEEWIDDRFPE